jgi:hypothetical protein
MIDAMAQQVPSSPVALTPTECGLNGMINTCGTYMTGMPGVPCVGVLITDGTPTQCDTDQANLEAIVAQGAANGVQTFTLGLPGADLTFLDALAQAGGTSAAIDVTQGAAAMVSAFNSIRSSVTQGGTSQSQPVPLDCTWVVPPAPAGGAVDQSKINVALQTPTGSTRALGHVMSAGDCGSVSSGWYYATGTAGELEVAACPDVCDLVQATQGVTVNVLFGCETVQAAPL